MNNSDIMLEELMASQIAPMLFEPETEPHIVISADRYITVPEELARIAVQYDHNIETVTFDCPRYWDGFDMSEMYIYINYARADNTIGMSIAKNITTDSLDSGMMHFDWTITRGATAVPGTLSFSVCIKKPDENGNEVNHWNTEINSQMYVSPGLEYEEQKSPQQEDLISDLLNRMEETENTVEKAGIIMNTEQMGALIAQFNSLKYELSKRTETVAFNAVIETYKWSSGSPPYTNVVSVPGILETDSPHAIPVYSDNNDVAILQEEAWNMISQGDAIENGITFTCFEDLPSVDIPIQIECFRTWIDDTPQEPDSDPIIINTAHRSVYVTLPAESWVTDGDNYYQVVSIEGVTPYSKVDLQPSPSQISTLSEAGVSLTTVNNDGIVTVYSINGAPTIDYVIQAFIVEVSSE